MNIAVEHFQMLTDIWRPKWRSLAATVAPKKVKREKERATLAVTAFYAFYGRDDPKIIWQGNPQIFELSDSPPFITHFRDSLIFSVWHKLANPNWVCQQVGYDPRHNIFRLPANMRMVLAHTQLKHARIRARPDWILQMSNVVSQLDADALAIAELGRTLGDIDPQITKLAAIVEEIASSCFAAILFESYCILVAKPQSIVIDDNQQMAARGTPSIEWSKKNATYRLYTIHGEVIAVNEPPSHNNLTFVQPRQRALMIEYMGWEEFFKWADQLSPHCRKEQISKDQFGTLYRIWFNNQEFLVVRVKNSTAEPDGSYRHFVIPVDPRLRPLPHPNKPHERPGNPQELTARNAVASTFYMTGDEYEAMLGKES
jgi:hypothetical protein